MEHGPYTMTLAIAEGMRSDEPKHMHVKHAQRPHPTPPLALSGSSGSQVLSSLPILPPLNFIFVFLHRGLCACHRVFGVTGGSLLDHIIRDELLGGYSREDLNP